MADEFSRAVSFANNYFALVDGLVSNLEDHLAEDVVLDWFGQTIKGRQSVAAFMKYHKISSRHVFNEISPRTSIGYRENRQLRRKYHSAGATLDNCNTTDSDDCHIKYKRKCYSDTYPRDEGSFSENSTLSEVLESEMDAEILTTSEELCETMKKPEITDSVIRRELDFDALSLDSYSTPRFSAKLESEVARNIFATPEAEMQVQLEPTNMDDIETSIAQLQASELLKTERGQADARRSSLKFLEAFGVVEFCKVFNSQQIRKDTRKRHCKLQIAYSVKDENSNSEFLQRKLNTQKPGKGLMNVTSQDYLAGDDYERNEFLQCLQLQMTKHESNINLFTPKYVRGQLKFDKPDELNGDGGFVFNYKIHVIIYESNTKCRLNLSHEFEGKEYLSTD